MAFFSRTEPNFQTFLSAQLTFASSALAKLEEWCRLPSQDLVDEIFAIETAADKARLDLTKALATAFETPLDREDLDDLSRMIDDVIDQVRHVVRAGAALKITPVEPIREMVANIGHGVTEVVAALTFLPRRLDDAQHHASQARRPLRLNERLYGTGVAELFEHEDVRFIFRQMEMFRSVITLSENLEDVADVLDHAINKLS